MPVRKSGGKWYWGSKGPFSSEAKARQVGRAAYANGYRGEKKRKPPPKSKKKPKSPGEQARKKK